MKIGVFEDLVPIHGLVEGINSLSPLQVITVDRDQVFKCPDLQRMEDVGPEEREMLANSVYNMSVAKGVFQVINNNKSQADLKRNRAQEFLDEVRKACSRNYYGRFNMLLGNELVAQGLNIAGDFTVKWQTVQDCLFKAIGDEQGVTRMSKFLALNYTKFSEQPLELLFNRVDHEVDAFLGKTNEVFEDTKKRKHCLFTYSLLTKYEIIFDIVRNLDSKFTLLKECVQKEVSKFYFNPTTILDIPDLQKHLYDKLDAKSLSTQYRTEPVIVGRKLPVHAASLKGVASQAEWTPEQSSQFQLTYQKRKIHNKKDDEIRNELITLARKLSDNKDLKDTAVSDHDQIKEVLKKNNDLKVCFYCMSPNCFTRKQVARGMGLQFSSRKECKSGEKMKFGKAKEALKLSSELPKPNGFMNCPKASTKQTVLSFKAQPDSETEDEVEANNSEGDYDNNVSDAAGSTRNSASDQYSSSDDSAGSVSSSRK